MATAVSNLCLEGLVERRGRRCDPGVDLAMGTGGLRTTIKVPPNCFLTDQERHPSSSRRWTNKVRRSWMRLAIESSLTGALSQRGES